MCERQRVQRPLLAATGARRGEVAALRWANVDLDGKHPSLRVEGSLQRTPEGLRVFPPKTERARRSIPIPASAVPMLKRVRAEQAERRLLCGKAWADAGYVFDRGDGRAMDPDDLTAAFRVARSRAKIWGARLHDLRHRFVSTLVDAGTSIRVVSDLAGHASPSFTLSVYAHADVEASRSAMAVVDDAFGDALAGG